MSTLATTDTLFFDKTALDRDATLRRVEDALHGADDGELYLEYTQTEGLNFDDGHIKSANHDIDRGFGLRAVSGEATGYAHASVLDDGALARAAETVKAVRHGESGVFAMAPTHPERPLYTDANPLGGAGFGDKVRLLEQIDAYARGRDERVVQVSASLTGQWRAVQIIRPGGWRGADLRPLVRLSVQIVCAAGDRRETGSSGTGGRTTFDLLFDETTWQKVTDEALAQALTNLDSVEAPAGEMPVVLGSGWPGILLHEAVGHGLEGDFNRKETSAFAGLVGESVASPGVTVIDEGVIDGRRGSLTMDDEGTPTSRTTLIEDGRLVGFMQDRMNARLMGHAATGNGRRQSYAHMPLPRMTNTYMAPGQDTPEDILKSVNKGLYAVNFGGGQVDITSGRFVFSCTEAYMIENGRVGAPVKGATLIGNGPEILTRVQAIGNDTALDPGIGVCGKEGQGVPVGVGQPTLLVSSITVGGTQV